MYSCDINITTYVQICVNVTWDFCDQVILLYTYVYRAAICTYEQVLQTILSYSTIVYKYMQCIIPIFQSLSVYK